VHDCVEKLYIDRSTRGICHLRKENSCTTNRIVPMAINKKGNARIT